MQEKSVNSRRNCNLCPLQGHKFVPSEGRADAEIVIVGEAPGAEEEKEGRPFVGKSGKILRGVLQVVGYDFGKLYITNVVKCRPSQNKLTGEVIKCCKLILEDELQRLVKKKLIIAVGVTAKEFFNISGSMEETRGRVFDTKYGKVLVTWHPAYRRLFEEDIVTGMSPYVQFVKDLVQAKRIVETGRMYKAVKYSVVEGSMLDELLANIRGKEVALDFETTGLDIWNGLEVITVGIAFDGGIYVVDLRKLGSRRAESFMNELFKRVGKLAVFNAGFDVVIGMKKYGWDLVGKWDSIEDVQAMWYLLSGGILERRDLKGLALDFMDIGQYWIEWGKKSASVSLERLYEYNAIDAYVTFELYKSFSGKLHDRLEWSEIYGDERKTLFDAYGVVKKLNALCCEMQRNGIAVNVEYFASLEKELVKKVNEIEQSVCGINLNSPKQVLRWLSETGVVVESTSRDELEELLKLSSINEEARRRIELLLQYRMFKKLLSTYVEPILTKWVKDDGLVHAKFSVVSTESGRLASSEPNLMNIPTRSGSMIENGFVSRFGCEGVVLKADFSQHELRVACDYSRDKKMKEFFESGIDLHTKVAIELYGLRENDSEERKKDLRRLAKGFNFGVLYGMGYKSVAESLGISESEAKAKIDEYFQLFSGLKRWLDQVKEFARRYGYVRNMFGRYRKLDTEGDGGWDRKAVNTPIQSAASDIAGMVAWDMVVEMKKRGLESKVVNFIHDAILVDCLQDEVDIVVDILKYCVERVERNRRFVEYEFEVETGRTWGEAKEK